MQRIAQYAQPVLCAYTRRPVPGRYPAGLAYGLHLAWSLDGQHFTALHRNYGILYAPGDIRADDTIAPKGIKAPWIFRVAQSGYGIAAVRIREDGAVDAQDYGSILVWNTEDFIDFDGPYRICFPCQTAIIAVQIRYEKDQGLYHALWRDEMGRAYAAACASLREFAEACASPAEWPQVPVPPDLPEDAVMGNCVEICTSLADRVRMAWDSIYAQGVYVPDVVTASDIQEAAQVRAQIRYCDGSSTTRAVDWDLSRVDFEKAGSYPAYGVVHRPYTGFPLAQGFADPVVFPWNGNYYFLATNDNTGAIGLFIREAACAEALFSADAVEHLILAPDEERGFVQTFWAPELHEIGGRLYILFAVSGKAWGPQCHMMRLKKDASPSEAGSWETPVRVCRADGSALAEEGITLDMTYFKTGTGAYLAWSYRRHIGTPKDTGSMLCLAKADEAAPWKLAGEPMLLSRPLLGWENCEHTINNEAPYALLHGGKVYLCYSGGAANRYSYAVGMLTADARADLTDPAVWKKASTPVISFASVEGEYGPGHASFFTDAEGNQMIAYLAVRGYDQNLRCTGIRRVHFDLQDRPVFDLSAQRDLPDALCRVKTRIKVVK